MSLNASIHYEKDALYIDRVPVAEIVAAYGTPLYIYSLPRILKNYRHIRNAFRHIQPHIHYSAKANGNLHILRTLIRAGAGIDAVSQGEIHRALAAGAEPASIVFAGVGKTPDEIRYALEQGVGWFNIENIQEAVYINQFAGSLGLRGVQVALRLNPGVTANTHPYIATGHGGAKFGLTADAITHILTHQGDYPNLHFSGLHIHIGSQLGDVHGTYQAIAIAKDLIAPYPHITTLNIGGGLPARYHSEQQLPTFEAFADIIAPLVKGYKIILEPGRSIVADAGILIAEVLYLKHQAGQMIAIVDASMTELVRPALYQARHEIVPIHFNPQATRPTQVVGPVCETSDVLGHDIPLPTLQPGDKVAILTTGAYGMVMASQYNARPRPAECIVLEDGLSWALARPRETWADLIAAEQTTFSTTNP